MDPFEPEVRFQETIRRTDRIKIGLIAGAVLVAVCSVAVALAESPSPGASDGSPSASTAAASAAPASTPTPTATSQPNAPTQPNPTTQPNGTAKPGNGSGKMPSFGGGFRFGFGFGGGDFGGRGGGSAFGPITVTAVNGSDVSLKTADGWTRTVTVTDSVKVSRGGAPATVGDIKVGDTVRLGQDRSSNGTYTVTSIEVVLPTLTGQVTGKSGDTITITLPGGTSQTIHVSGDTVYTVAGKTNGTLSDVGVGDWLIASGTQRSDGSLDATAVRAGSGGGWFHGPGGGGMPFGPKPNASPGATSAPG